MLINKRVCDICGADVPEALPEELPLEGFDGPQFFDFCPTCLRKVWAKMSEDISAQEGHDILGYFGLLPKEVKE